LIISERNEKNINYYNIREEDRQLLHDKWRFDYLGLRNRNITPLDSFLSIKSNLNASHMIVDKRGNFEQFNYFQNIEPIYRKLE
jgi:hypothetical protein